MGILSSNFCFYYKNRMAAVPKKTIRWANNEGEPLEKIKEFYKTNLVELPPPVVSDAKKLPSPVVSDAEKLPSPVVPDAEKLPSPVVPDAEKLPSPVVPDAEKLLVTMDTKDAIDKEISKLPYMNSSDIVVSLELAETILNIIESANKIGYTNKKFDGLITRLNKILDSIITLNKIKAYIPKYHNYDKNNGAALIADYQALLQRREPAIKVVEQMGEEAKEEVEEATNADTSIPSLLNIAGEIINLGISVKSGNSGRMNYIEFMDNFTKDENEIKILTKVFGIRSLRNTPSILTEEGCTLNDEEKEVVTRILEKRKKTLEEGLSLTRGVLADTTRMKISRLKLLLKLIDEGFDNKKECMPSANTVMTPSMPGVGVGVSMPSIPTVSMPSMPNWMKGKNKSTEELLISLFLLLIGISSEKIKAKNVQDILGDESIDSLLTKLKSKSLTPENIDSTSSKILTILEKLGPVAPSGPTAAQAVTRVSTLMDDIQKFKNPEAKEDAQNIIQFGKMIENYIKLEVEFDTAIANKVAKEAEKAGAEDAKTFIKKLLETQEAGLKDLQGRHNASVDNAIKAELQISINTKTSLITIFREKISAIDTNLIKLTSEIGKSTKTIETAQEKVQKLKDEGVASLKLMKEISAKKQKELETEIRQKDEQLTPQKKLLEELLAKKAPTKATEKEIKKTESDRASLEKEVANLKERNTEMETEFQKLISKSAPEVKVNPELIEKESVRLRIDALEAAHAKTNDTDIGVQLVKLKGVRESKNNFVPNASVNNKAKLESFLSEQNGGNRPNIKDIDSVLEKFLFQTALIEKDDERFCLLYYFISYFWKSVRDNLEKDTEKEYLDNFDKHYFPDMKRDMFWPTIILIAKIIHKMRSIANEKVAVLTSDMNALLDKLESQKKNDEPYLLENIYDQVDIFLPQSPVFAIRENGAWKLEKAPEQECSVLQIGPLYLLLMKVAHRYIYTIIEESPNRLKCQSRLNPTL